MELLRGEHGKALLQVNMHLVTKSTDGTGAGPITLMDSVV